MLFLINDENYIFALNKEIVIPEVKRFMEYEQNVL